MGSFRRAVVGLLVSLPCARAAFADNFTTGTANAKKFGVHEIVLTGNGSVANPFDTACTVAFTPPSGAAQAKTVLAFYDGGSTWRARVYVSETGTWTWRSSSSDPGLNGRSGSFVAEASALRGRLLAHPRNPKHWMTENGRWFLNLNDTSYYLTSPKDATGAVISTTDFQNYVRDAAARGITSFRSTGVRADSGDESWTAAIFSDSAYTKFRTANFQRTDERLRWMLNFHPDLYLQFILFPRNVAWGRDETFWKALSSANRTRVMKYMIARYAAFPAIFWLVVNDTHYGASFPNNDAMAREVGTYFASNDPWRHPMSTGPNRNRDFPFPGESWVTYIHIEDEHDLGAAEYAKYASYAKPVFLGEDRYEQDHGSSRDPVYMRYWQRRLFWAWLLSGGSANYGGRWWVLHPYSQTGTRSTTKPGTTLTFTRQLVGLDSAGPIPRYFADRGIELSDFQPDHGLASDLDGRTGAKAPRLLRRGTSEYLVYHPNAAADGQSANVDAAKNARVRVNLSAASGSFQVEWFRVHDGVAQGGGTVSGGAARDFTAPWTGHDAVLRLKAASGQTPYRGAPAPLPGTVQAEDYDLGGEGMAYHDTTAGNAGGAYRSDSVDLQATTDAGGGVNVGWVDVGEWLEYTVNVGTAGTYTLEARVATPNAGRAFHVEFGGVNKTGAVAVPVTGGYQTWQTVTKTGLSLSAGTQVMRFVAESGGFNVNWFRLGTGAAGGFAVTIDSVSTGKPYSLGTAQAGALPYVDRSYTILSLSAALSGGRMIRTAMDDKYVTAASHLRFTVSEPATAYACMDVRTARLPLWLQDGTWTATTLSATTTDGPASPMRVYSRAVPAGSLTLGGNHHGGDTGARANYFVILKAASAPTSLAATDGLPEDVWEHPGDSDGDGLRDEYEAANGLDPARADTDGNGTPDEEELTGAGISHWDRQEAGGTPGGGGDGGGGGGCGATGLELLLVFLARRGARRFGRSP
jgi:hypothetical protein